MSSRWNSFIQFLAESQQLQLEERQTIVDELLATHDEWPWVERDRATFVYDSRTAESVAINLDIINTDPPFENLVQLEGTTLWYLQRYFDKDALLDYMYAVNDPGTPLAQEVDLVGRINKYWEIDPRNKQMIDTTQIDVSVLRMGKARPFPNWRGMWNIPRGHIYEHEFSSVQMDFSNRKLWVYTPPGYTADDGKMYPLLIMMDGQWAVDAFEVPYIADALIKHNRMEPVIIAMLESGSQADRINEYVSNDKHYSAILTELLPTLQTEYLIDSTNLGIAGVGEGAVAAAHAALKNSAVFAHLIMLSPPLGRGPAAQKLQEYAERFRDAKLLPRHIFQSVGRYEQKLRFYRPAMALRGILERRLDTDPNLDYKFVELGSGHSLAAFKSILPEALAFTFPVE
jgi:enterochelin esterase-like enzyme